MAGELERIQTAVQQFTEDAADRRAAAAAVANAYTTGRPMGPGTVAVVEAMMGRTMSVADAVAAVEAESGTGIFGPEVGGRPGRPEGGAPGPPG